MQVSSPSWPNRPYLSLHEASNEVLLGCGRLLLMVAELELKENVHGNFGNLKFVQEYRTRSSQLPCFKVMMGHNHMSNTSGIGLPGT